MSNSTVAAPITRADRNVTLDVLRGFAVLGILAANIWNFALPISMPMIGVQLDNAMGDWNGVIFWVGAVDGVMRTLFSLMFGAGMVLMLSNLEKKDIGVEAANIYFRRIVWLFVFGLVNAFIFMWPGDILFMYALAGFILFGVRKLSTKALLLICAVILIFHMSKAYMGYTDALENQAETQTIIEKSERGSELTAAEKQKLTQHQRRNNFDGYIQYQAQPEIDKVQGSFWSVFKERARWSVIIESRFVYQQFFLDVVIMLIMGIVFYRIGFLTGDWSTKRLLQATIMGLVIGGGIRFGYVVDLINADGLASAKAKIFYDIGRLALAVFWLGLLQLFVRSGVLSFLRTALAKAGQMALTNYLTQSIMCAFIFYGFGFGLFGELRGWEPYYYVLGIWVLQLIWSPIWLKHYRYGPFEWVWRSLTYGEKQPMKRVREGETA